MALAEQVYGMRGMLGETTGSIDEMRLMRRVVVASKTLGRPLRTARKGLGSVQRFSAEDVKHTIVHRLPHFLQSKLDAAA